MMRGRESRGERAPDRVPGTPLTFLAELIAALGTEDQVVADPSRFPQDSAASGFRDIDRSGAVVLGICFAAERGAELTAQVVDVTVKQAVARRVDLARAHAAVGRPDDQRREFLAERAAVMHTRDARELVYLIEREHDDVLATPTGVQTEPSERVL